MNVYTSAPKKHAGFPWKFDYPPLLAPPGALLQWQLGEPCRYLRHPPQSVIFRVGTWSWSVPAEDFVSLQILQEDWEREHA